MVWTTKANLRGPQGIQGIQGVQGLPGVLAVDNDTAVAGYISTAGTSATKTALAVKLDKTEAATTYARLVANTVVLFGTSLEAQNYTGSDILNAGSNTALNGRGWFTWCNAFTGDQLKLVANAGVGGNTYAQMLARINTDVLAYESDWVFIGGPVNDIIQGRTAAAIIADATAILDALRGRKVLILTATPTASYNTTAMKTVLSTVNAWINDLPKIRRGVTVADAWATLADRATGAGATGMTILGSSGSPTDDIHWSVAGAIRVGKVAAAAIAARIANVPKKASHNADPLSVIANPEFLTAGSGWALYGATVAYAAAADYFGNKATLTVAANTVNDERAINFLENISGARFAAGSIVQASVRVKWSGLVGLGIAAKCTPVLVVRQRRTDGTFGPEAAVLGVSSSQLVVPNAIPTTGDVVFTTTKLTIEASASPIDRLYVYLGWVGASDVVAEFSELSVLKVS